MRIPLVEEHARFVQGFGAAILIANSAAIITDAFTKEQLETGLGTNMMATNVGAVTGYSLSGIMIDNSRALMCRWDLQHSLGLQEA